MLIFRRIWYDGMTKFRPSTILNPKKPGSEPIQNTLFAMMDPENSKKAENYIKLVKFNLFDIVQSLDGKKIICLLF